MKYLLDHYLHKKLFEYDKKFNLSYTPGNNIFTGAFDDITAGIGKGTFASPEIPELMQLGLKRLTMDIENALKRTLNR